MKKTILLSVLLIALSGCQDHHPGVFGDAKWIGTSESVLYSDYLPQFTVETALEFADGSSRASLLFGANDPRLMDADLNILGVDNDKDESFIQLELDVEKQCVNVYRTGYTVSDRPGVVFKSLPIPEDTTASAAASSSYKLRAEVSYSEIKVFVDDKALGQVNVGPLGHGGDYIAYPQLSEIGYLVEEGQTVTFKSYEVRENRVPNAVLASIPERTTSGGKLLMNPDHGGMPMLRSHLDVKKGKTIESATLCATARGIYQLSINGKRVGNSEYTPGLSQYNKHHFYQTYDVTDLLSTGTNEIFAQLGEGWWSGDLTFGAGNRNYFGDQLALLASLRVKYSDGSESVFVTDPKTWEASTSGPVVYASMFQGEVYDARKTVSAASWKMAEEMKLDGHTSSATFGPTAPRVDEYDDFQLLPQIDPDPSVYKVLTAQSVTEVRPGVFVYDMGQNFAGIPSISFSGLEPGQQVRMRYAEILYPENGMLMLENIRGAMAQDIYISSGDPEVFEPHFTQHGYRYVELTGIDKALKPSDVKGLVISSVQDFTAHYESSNPLVNRLWENIQWSMLSNFISIPTDCPQRNERMGWSGDLSVFSRTATYLSNVDEFLRRHTLAIRDVQMPDGRMPDVAPIGGAFGGLLWGSAGITVPYECYAQYADTLILEQNYEAMDAYMTYIENNYIDKETSVFKQGGRGLAGGLGDWLGPQNAQLDNWALFDAYYMFDLKIMQEAASVLGKDADSQRFAERLEERKKFWVSTYLDPATGRFISPSYFTGKENAPVHIQSSYVLPLAFGLIDDPDMKKKVADNLVSTITSRSISDTGVNCPPYSLMTGFITTAWISKALSDSGHSDVAYKLLQQTTYPSWLYPVLQGATTIWERLDSYTKENGFGGNNSMNSFNHYSFGAVGQWLMAYSLGIDRDPSSPGFKHFILHPEADPTREMTFARGWYDCAYGRIQSSWEYRNDGSVEYRFVIPEGTSATLRLPGRPDEELGAGEHVR